MNYAEYIFTEHEHFDNMKVVFGLLVIVIYIYAPLEYL